MKKNLREIFFTPRAVSDLIWTVLTMFIGFCGGLSYQRYHPEIKVRPVIIATPQPDPLSMSISNLIRDMIRLKILQSLNAELAKPETWRAGLSNAVLK